MQEKLQDRMLAECEECRSEYYRDASQMPALCPECAHWLYGYPNCQHQFVNGRCALCYWNGNSSDYTTQLRTQ